jgi:hypothetical protein
MRRLLFFLLLASQPVLAQKTGASLECKYTGKDFIYDCRIALQRGGEPLSGAEITVGADMPSMPMAHNIKPVKAKPTSRPGEYQARLDLEMPGEWAVKLRIAGPVRDQLVLHYNFTESGTAPRN